MAEKQITYVMNLRGQFESRLNKSNNATKRFDRSMGQMIGRFATFAAIGGILGNSVKKIADFEEATSNLSAITGATGEDLDFLKSKAIEMGKATTKSSIDTVTAFKLIASSKPELLNNAQALADVTKEAIALSEASGLALPEAATALTDALNQFNLSGKESSRVINVLAAGSKFGSAEIPDLTASLKEFGGVAESLKMPIEESVAAVEILAKKGIKASRSGIMMRNVLLKMASAANKKYNPAIVGFNKALENLSPIQDDVTKLTKMFGRQNVIAAQTLIKERVAVEDLNKAVKGTAIAYEQASVNTNNLNSDVKRLSSAWEGFVLNLNKGEGRISNNLRSITQGLTRLIRRFDEANTSAEKLGQSRAEKTFETTRTYIFRQEEQFQIPRLQELIESHKRLIRFRKKQQEADVKTIFFAKRKKKALAVNMKHAQETLNMMLKLQDELLNPEKATPILSEIEPVGLKEVEAGVTRITAAAPKVFNITVQKMTGIETLNTTTVKEGIQQTGESVLEQIQIALADMQVVAS